jgi:hypothetical protein
MVELFLTTIWNVPGASGATTTSALSVETAGGRTRSVGGWIGAVVAWVSVAAPAPAAPVAASPADPIGASSTSSCQPRNVSHAWQNDADSGFDAPHC